MLLSFRCYSNGTNSLSVFIFHRPVLEFERREETAEGGRIAIIIIIIIIIVITIK
jgi:hypothetical protein